MRWDVEMIEMRREKRCGNARSGSWDYLVRCGELLKGMIFGEYGKFGEFVNLWKVKFLNNFWIVDKNIECNENEVSLVSLVNMVGLVNLSKIYQKINIFF